MKRLWLISLAAALVCTGAPNARAQGPPEVFTVNQVTDGEDVDPGDVVCDANAVEPGRQCSLRAAIQESNLRAGSDDIKFSIPGKGVHTLFPTSPLPAITDNTGISGFSQSGAARNTRRLGKPLDTRIRIELDGSLSLATDDSGLTFQVGIFHSVSGLSIGNWTNGIRVLSGMAFMSGNTIGLDASGTKLRSNTNGVVIDEGGRSLINVFDEDGINVISGNTAVGLLNEGSTFTLGNYIGTTFDPRVPAANGFGLGGTSVFVGEDASAVLKSNVIANAPGVGVRVVPGADPASVRDNRIFGHDSGLGIDIGPQGLTPNDEGDTDGFTNFPVIRSARRKGSGTRVKGVLDGTVGEKFFIDVYVADENTRQGRLPVGSERLTLPPSGKFQVRADRVREGKRLVATATLFSSSGGLTSEFSEPIEVK